MRKKIGTIQSLSVSVTNNTLVKSWLKITDAETEISDVKSPANVDNQFF